MTDSTHHTMRCQHCQSSRITRLKTPTELGYCRFQCRTCRSTYNERTGTPFNFLEFPTDLVMLVVLWRLRFWEERLRIIGSVHLVFRGVKTLRPGTGVVQWGERAFT